MNTIRITTSQNIELEYELSSLGERIVGYLIDRFILGAYLLIVVLIFLSAQLESQEDWLIYIFIIPAFFYDIASEVLMNGQTVGKRVMNIKVVSLDGGQASLGQYLIRWLFRLVDFYGTFNLCALICIAVSERKQRVGDMVAGTTLIKTKPRTNFQQTIYTPTAPVDYTVSFPEVINLTDKDMQLIKEVITRVNMSGNSILANQAAEKIKQTLQIESNLDPRTLLHVLLADYNHLSSLDNE